MEKKEPRNLEVGDVLYHVSGSGNPTEKAEIIRVTKTMAVSKHANFDLKMISDRMAKKKGASYYSVYQLETPELKERYEKTECISMISSNLRSLEKLKSETLKKIVELIESELKK